MADLHQGDHGPEVLMLKAGLRRRGYPPVHDDDAFDADTAATLRVFQRSCNLDADGVADDRTWRALREKDTIPRWFTRYGGALSIPLVTLGVLVAIGICAALAALAHRVLVLLGLHDLPIEIYGFSVVCVLLSLWLLIGPALIYVYSGQARKIEAIRGFYSPDVTSITSGAAATALPHWSDAGGRSDRTFPPT
jgi:peptidoglycan hydrolase-like protein with peptidoglycan-binding domain